MLEALCILTNEAARFPKHFQECWIPFPAKESGAHPVSTPDPAADTSDPHILFPAAVPPRRQAENLLQDIARDLTEMQLERTPRQLRKSPQRCMTGDHWLPVLYIITVCILPQRLYDDDKFTSSRIISPRSSSKKTLVLHSHAENPEIEAWLLHLSAYRPAGCIEVKELLFASVAKVCFKLI